MSVLPRFVAPAGTVLRGSDLAGWLRGAFAGDAPSRALAEALASRYGLGHVFLLSSARAGMTLVLRALAERAGGRDEVVIPGYTCYSVAASAVRAGLKVRPVDVQPQTLDFAPAALAGVDMSRTVAIVGTSLYGIPADLPSLEGLARERGVAFVDDAAQCLDGQVGGRWAGSFGDAGLFSFDKGKNITSLQGGVITCRDPDLAERIGRLCAAMPAPGAVEVAMQSAKLLAYALLLRPWLYWLPNKVLRLGETPFELEYPTTRLAPSLAALVGQQLRRIDEITASRIRNAEALQRGIAGTAGILVPARVGSRSVFPRVPFVQCDGARRDPLLAALRRSGYGATGSYPAPLFDVPGIRPHLAPGTLDTPGARTIARGMVTLPTHGHLRDADVAAMVRIVQSSQEPPSPT